MRDDDLLVVDYAAMLQRPGPYALVLHALLAKGIAVADLDRPAEDELIVGFLAGSADDATIRERIVDWAELVGFRRLWFPDEVIALDPPARELGSAYVECSGCAAAYRNGDADFWAMVRRCKLFPSSCLVCGLQLAQWTHESTVTPPAAAWFEHVAS